MKVMDMASAIITFTIVPSFERVHPDSYACSYLADLIRKGVPTHRLRAGTLFQIAR
jgi:hypothetical protein